MPDATDAGAEPELDEEREDGDGDPEMVGCSSCGTGEPAPDGATSRARLLAWPTCAAPEVCASTIPPIRRLRVWRPGCQAREA